MTKEEFFARVDEAREEIRQGKGKRFSKPAHQLKKPLPLSLIIRVPNLS